VAAPPRVVLVTTSFPLAAGATSGVFVERLAAALAERVAVRVVAPAGEARRAEAPAGGAAAARPYGVRAVRYAPRRWRTLAHRPGGLPAALARRDPALLLLPALLGGLLAGALAEGRCGDLLHGQWAIGGLVAGLAGRLLGRPVITTLRGSDVTRAERSAADRRLLALCLAWSDAAVAVSPSLAARAAALVPAAAGRVEAIANGVDDAFWAVPPPATLPGRLRLLGVGNLVAHKDVETAVRAVAALPAAVELTWLGDGPLRGRLEALAGELGAGGRVRFAGAVPPDAVPAALAGCDAFLFTSRGEGRPNALVEALAAGRPAAAPRVPGVEEMAAPERGVLPYEAGDAASLVAVLGRLLAEPQLAAGLAAAARLAAAALAGSWRDTAESYDRLYRRLLAARRDSS
jgi:glycosyltransferase involved in cell wall biosynthesis